MHELGAGSVEHLRFPIVRRLSGAGKHLVGGDRALRLQNQGLCSSMIPVSKEHREFERMEKKRTFAKESTKPRPHLRLLPNSGKTGSARDLLRLDRESLVRPRNHHLKMVGDE